MQKRLFLIAFLFVLAVGFGVAQNDTSSAGTTDAGPRVIDIDSAVKLALQNNLQLETERLTVEQKRRSKDTVWNRFIPSLSAGATMARTNLEQTNPITSQPYPRWNLSATLQARLDLTVSLFQGIRLTVQDYEAGLLSLADTRKKIERDVRKQFYNILLLEQQIQLTRDSIDQAQKRYEQTKVNYDNGLVDEYTLLSSQVALENIKPQLENLQLAHRNAIMGFNQMLGLDVNKETTLKGNIEPQMVSLNTDELIKSHLSDRFDLQQIRQYIQILKTQKEAIVGGDGQSAGLLPVLSFGFTADPTFQGDPTSDPLFADISNDWQQTSRGAFSITITQPLDGLVPGSQTRVRIANLENDIQKQYVNLQQATEGAEIQVRGTIQNLNKVQQTLKVKELNVTLAERAYSLAQEAYQAGTRDLLEVQNAEQELRQARVQVLSEKYNYVSGLLDLEYALNASLDELQGKDKNEGSN